MHFLGKVRCENMTTLVMTPSDMSPSTPESFSNNNGTVAEVSASAIPRSLTQIIQFKAVNLYCRRTQVLIDVDVGCFDLSAVAESGISIAKAQQLGNNIT